LTIKALIFDMDGLLADTEPLWQEAEIAVFSDLGFSLNREMCQKVMGLRIDEVINHWITLFSLKNANPKVIESRIIETLLSLIDKHATLLPGVQKVLDLAQSNGLALGLASSSHLKIIDCLLNKLQIRACFSTICSAEYETFGKPHPAVFLTAAKELNVLPQNCLVFEDSINGVIAARAARMSVIAIPEKEHLNDVRFSIANKVLPSLEFVTFPFEEMLSVIK